MTVSITIRHVPQEIRDRLAAKARRSGQSLQEYLNAELAQLAVRPSPVDFVRGLDANVELNTDDGLTTAEILEALDADRR
ncbi:FitA-like ribbon-helix-helix domain-containing protein [Arthrobacter sulfonylureivorans]|uniref:FitA-like ribbon-helix-helix domain-containing protein n=1 Tax=Arthrobacter sulfonylureivorans TaxID=2486855 RepID=UPI0039E2AA53